MKKNIIVILLIISILITASAPVFAKDVIAKPTSSTVLVNGNNLTFDAYDINNNNYFKLRDLAYSLSGAAKQFNVKWDGINNAIFLESGRLYEVIGGEMMGTGTGDKTAVPTTSRIYLDDIEIRFISYNIEGNNYFKLRDIGAVFNFGVNWDGGTNTIFVDTGKGYTPGNMTVDIVFDSKYYAYGDQLLKTRLFSYRDEIYVPLQGIFEANYMTFIWNEATQTAMATHNGEITTPLSEIAERWAYPFLARGSYRAAYVRLSTYDDETRTLNCEGRELKIPSLQFEQDSKKTYSLQLTAQEHNRYKELLAYGLGKDVVYRLVIFYPYPLAAGQLPPEAYEPVFVELINLYSEKQKAGVRAITLNVNNMEGLPMLIPVEALEYEGQLYISVNALNDRGDWNRGDWFGSLSIE